MILIFISNDLSAFIDPYFFFGKLPTCSA